MFRQCGIFCFSIRFLKSSDIVVLFQSIATFIAVYSVMIVYFLSTPKHM